MMTIKTRQSCLIACNIYVSAGRPSHQPFLLQLLKNAQELCHRRKKESPDDQGAVVHAFADGPYDRSSFHIAGSPSLVSDVVSTLATDAVSSLSAIRQESLAQDDSTGGNGTPHPTVGLVDHISVLPLAHNDEQYTWQEWFGSSSSDTSKDEKQIITGRKLPSRAVPSGWVARAIGHALEESPIGVDVFFYGHAHHDRVPLATVRRESTQFFQSSNNNCRFEKLYGGGQATVGAPDHFVENFNIRLTRDCSKKAAQSLTKCVREKDGGLPFVEALTLKYSQGRLEVACNLLHPGVTSADDIINKVNEWESTQGGRLVEIAYRVGTTRQQCLDALEQTRTREGEEQFNQDILERFEDYLSADDASLSSLCT